MARKPRDPNAPKRVSKPRDPDALSLKKADAELRPCQGVGKRFRVEGACNVTRDGLFALHLVGAVSPGTIAGDIVPGVRGFYAVTHVPSGLCIRTLIQGSKPAREYLRLFVKLCRERNVIELNAPRLTAAVVDVLARIDAEACKLAALTIASEVTPTDEAEVTA